MTVLRTKNDLPLKQGSAVVHYTANATITVVGNNAVSTIANAGETVSSAKISQIWYGAGPANSFWTVSRGANTVAVLTGSGHMPFNSFGSVLDSDEAATVVLNLYNASDDEGFIMIELKTKVESE